MGTFILYFLININTSLLSYAVISRNISMRWKSSKRSALEIPIKEKN